VEANAPCILWVDELEKAIGGINSNDSGTTMRIFGKLLTWMGERTEMVYLYCTSNNLDAIPPEFKRAGRLDSIWWTEIPTESECKKIIQIHCTANKINVTDVEFNILAAKAFDMQMTGAEIEHVILDSCFKAAKQAKILREEISVSKDIILLAMNQIRTYAANNEEALTKSRLEALDKFEFTSSESRKFVEKLKGNIEARRNRAGHI
jgi:SpoVK/Ycf46/Vps4 family AAA+-type ATPase